MPDLQNIIALIESKRKTHLPWKRDAPVPQPFYTFSPRSQTWEPDSTPPTQLPTAPSTTFNIFSWNVDFMLPHPDHRMQIALNHLHALTSASPHPSIIFLAETLDTDLTLIQNQPWIRSAYHITDLSPEHWESGHYGTTMLIHHTLPLQSVFRVHFAATKMERDGLFVDLHFPSSTINSSKSTIRVCTSHLESLIANPPLRPKQVATLAPYLHAPDITGGIVGGDFNAIEPFDRTLHSDHNLTDAYLHFGGKEDAEEGYTWGQMAPVKQREMFGCSRMDKLWFCGEGVRCTGFERFGLGVEAEDGAVRAALVREEGMDGGWVTDHAGVRGVFELVGGGGEGKKAEAKM